jgi:nicotinate-nucleotide adenylyltransferase
VKTCIFGGTFDPPHFGHLLIAQTICEAENFPKILFVPALKPPLKPTRKITSIKHRIRMLELATLENPNFEISDVEIKRGGISYSLDTIRDIKETNNLDKNELFFLVGSDILKDFKNWHSPKILLNECQVIVALRPGFKPSSIPSWILSKIRFANIPRYEISSTTIRKRWKDNKTIRYMVTQPVWEYINRHNLYNR